MDAMGSFNSGCPVLKLILSVVGERPETVSFFMTKLSFSLLRRTIYAKNADFLNKKYLSCFTRNMPPIL